MRTAPARGTCCAVGCNKFVIIGAVEYSIAYYSGAVQQEILALPDTLAARYIVLTRRMVSLGPNLGEPHTKAFGEGLFELRLKGAEGIARVFFCALVGRRIVMLHCFVKKSRRTPARELEIAQARLKEVKRALS
jgi:phage-related protein